MNETLQRLIQALSSGQDPTSILRLFSGSGGSASYDGLQSMIMQRNIAMSQANPLRYDNAQIQNSASAFLDTLGINPYDGLGQGLAKNMVHAYRLAPDIVGSLIGLPNSQSFFQQIANGAAGINVAAGRGLPQLFNPYSAQSAYNYAVDLSRQVSNLAATPGKGYNIDFTHGLNMSELGKVSQRLLSSQIPYKRYSELDFDKGNAVLSENQEKFDTTSKEFREQLEKFGKSINGTVSMLTKLTGSVDESIRLLDQLAGGNFLGGSAEDAMLTARRARGIAANIRVTAAMAGIDPKEAYNNMLATQQGLIMRSGVDPRLASASGYDSLLMHQAANATISYNMWAAQHPEASKPERERAILAAQSRSMQYVGTSGEALAAMVSAHTELFTQDELNAIKTAYSRGDPDSIREMVQNKIGRQAYEDYMNDPAAIQGFRNGGDQELQKQLADAAAEGNIVVAEMEGGRRMLSNNLARTDNELSQITGDRRFRSKDRREAATNALREMAKKYGLSEEAANGMNIQALRTFLAESGADTRIIERTEHSAEIEQQLSDIERNTMDSKEEQAAKQRLSSFIDTLGLSDAEKERIKNEVNKDGANLNAIYSKLTRRMGLKYDPSVLGNKLSKAESERMRKGLEGDRQYWSVGATKEELQRAVGSMAGVVSLFGTMSLSAIIGDETFKSDETSDADAMKLYDQRVQDLRAKGVLPSQGTAEDNAQYDKEVRTQAINNAAKNALSLDEDAKDNHAKEINERIQATIQQSIAGGDSFKVAMQKALQAELSTDSAFAHTEDEKKRLEQLLEQSGKEDSDINRNRFNRTTIVSEETILRNKDAAKQLKGISDKLFESIDSEDPNAGTTFYEQVEKLAEVGMLDKKALEGIDRNNLDTSDKRLAALEKLTPDAIKKRANGIRAALGSTNNDPNAAALAWIVTQAEKQGLDVKSMQTLVSERAKELGYSEEDVVKLTQHLDDTYAAKNVNALSNAINFGGGSFAQKEIEKGKKVIEDLRGGLSDETLQGLNSTDEGTRNKARDAVRAKLKEKYGDDKDKVEYGVKFAAALSGSTLTGKDGKSISGIDVLKDKEGKLELSDDHKSEMLEVTKKAYNSDSSAYDVLTAISKVIGYLEAIYNSIGLLGGVIER